MTPPMSLSSAPADSPPGNSSTSSEPTHLNVPLSLSPHTTLQILIHTHLATPLIFLTTTTPASSSTSALGSFVYALPNRLRPSEPLCTTLYAHPGSVDFATRVAKIVAKRLGRPTYVGWSGELGAAGGNIGGQFGEEMEGFRKAVEGIMGALGKAGEERNG